MFELREELLASTNSGPFSIDWRRHTEIYHRWVRMNEFDWLQKEIITVIGDNPLGIPPGNILFRLAKHDHYVKVRPTWVKLSSATRDEMVVSATLKLLQRGLIKFVVERSRGVQGSELPEVDVVKVRKLAILDALAAL